MSVEHRCVISLDDGIGMHVEPHGVDLCGG
jgi:hypothetical protein